jgi:hypothetical protein
MIVVVNRGDMFHLRWCCSICHKRCTLDSLWLAFPAHANTKSPAEGKWIHDGCLTGKRVLNFGTPHVVTMRGIDALRQLAEALNTIDV